MEDDHEFFDNLESGDLLMHQERYNRGDQKGVPA
jgi:hypothetical protein